MTVSVDKPIICPVLIGRTPELTGLRAQLEQVKGGHGQVVVISGEAGIGKSRLMMETRAIATTEGFLVLQGSCFPADRSCPYAPLLDLLRSFLATDARARIIAELGLLTDAFFPLLPDLLPQPSEHPLLPPLDAEQEKRRLFAGLTHVFTSQTCTSPLLLVIEDLHWSDDTSLEFLHYLARRCASHPFMLLLTYRSEEVHPVLQHLLAQLDRERLAGEYVLAHLTRSEVEAMLQAIFVEQRGIPDELRELLYTLTDGNPFFIEEVLKSLLTSRRITFTDSGWMRLQTSAAPDGHLSIPRSVQDAVSQRTRRLSPQAKQLLMLAAVAGRRFDVSVLQRLLRCNASQLVRLLQEVVAAQLVVEESADRFSFRHALTRQAMYTGLLVRERRALHRRVTCAIEQLFASPTDLDAHLADLAYHCFEGEEWEKAQEACRVATEIGHRQWAAAAYCTLGVTYLLQLEPICARDVLETGMAVVHEVGSTWWIIQTTIALARVYLLQNELEQAEAALAAVLPREQRPRNLAERSGRLVWGELALCQGQSELALQIAQELWETVPGAATLPGGQPIPQLLKLQGEALIELGRVEEAIQVLEEAKRGTVERYEHARLWYMHGLLGRAYRLAGQEKLARRELLAARTIIASLATTIDEPALREQFTQAAFATFWPGEKPHPDHLLETAKYNGLTAREREVAALMAQGKTNSEIAEGLGVTKRTVETHIGNILDKLCFSSRTQVIVWAIERGLIKR